MNFSKYIIKHLTALETTLILLCCCLTVTAENATIQASIEKDSMLIGEQQNLSLSIEYNSSKTLIIPQFQQEIAKNILIVNQFTFDTTKADNAHNKKLQATIPFTCFDAGEYSFVVGPFLYGKDTIWSNPVTLSVQTVAIDSCATIKPIKPIQEPQYSLKDYIPKILIIIAILLVITLIVLAIWYFLKKRKNKPILKKAIKKEKADVKALRDLEELKSLNLCEKEEYKSFYTELTNILRTYFGEVLEIDTFEKTSDELLREISASGKMPLSVIQNLQIVLKEADYVKFAKHKPTVETGNLHYGLSLFCINESKHLISLASENEQK